METESELARDLFAIIAFPTPGVYGNLAKYSDIAVRGSVENIQNLVLQAFTSNGFTIQWDGPTKGKAEKGSKGANILLGAQRLTTLSASKSFRPPRVGL